MKRSVVIVAMLACASLLVGASVSWAAKTVNVSIQNLQFMPATVTIKVGDSVTWTNNDDRDHTVSAENGSFASGNLSSGKSFTQRFTQKGTYAYGCQYHPRMKGVVVVKE